MSGQLLLLPNLLNKEARHDLFLPKTVDKAVASLDGLIAENEKEARAYLKRFDAPFREMPIRLLNKHNREIEELLEPIKQGQKWGLISDAGLPILADPGCQIVYRARELGILIKTFIGPCSIIIALQLSGLPAQRFAFHGYLPKNPETMLKKLENQAKEERATQLFIEAPFRNQHLLEKVIKTLSDDTLFCVAWNLTMPTQGIETHRIKTWKRRSLPNLKGSPAIFLLS